MPIQTSTRWEQVLTVIRDRISAQSFQTWFSNLDLLDWDEGTLRLGAANLFVKTWFEKNYKTLVQEILRQEFKLTPNIQVTISPEKFRAMRDVQTPIVNKTDTPTPSASANTSSLRTQTTWQDGLALNPDFTFETFVDGSSTQIAAAAAHRVAETPGEFTPLLFWGGHGLGKTHLLQGICHHLQTHAPETRVHYVSGNGFVQEYTHAVTSKTLMAFRRRYRGYDVLVIDDFHSLGEGNKQSTQEEFLSLFDQLSHRGGQVILGCDRPPEELSGLSEKLRNRLCGGLSARLSAPDTQMRKRIIERKAARRNVVLSQEMVDYLTLQELPSVRELQGAVNRLAALYRLTGQPLSLTHMRDLFPTQDTTAARLDCQTILAAVAREFSVSVADLQGRKRARTILLARQVAIHLCRVLTHASLNEIGKAFGSRSHSTILSALRNTQALFAGDKLMHCRLRGLLHQLGVERDIETLLPGQGNLF